MSDHLPPKVTATTFRFTDVEMALINKNAARLTSSSKTECIKQGQRLLDRVLTMQTENKKIGYINEYGQFVEILFFL